MDDLQLYIRHTVCNLVKGIQKSGNYSAMARALGMSNTNLRHLLDKWEIPREEAKAGVLDLTNDLLDTQYYKFTKEGEVWKRSSIDRNLFVSNKCNVLVVLANGSLTPAINFNGSNNTWYVKYARNRHTKLRNLALLVAAEFLPGKPDGRSARFKDGVLGLDNLEWKDRRRVGKAKETIQFKSELAPVFKEKPEIEEWKDSPSYPEWFSVSNHGRVYMKDYFNHKDMIRRGKILSSPVDRRTITAIRYDSSGNTVRVNFTIAKEVALAFIPNPDNYKYIYYVGGMLGGNGVENIVWVEHLVRKSVKDHLDFPSKKDFINAIVFSKGSIGSVMQDNFGRAKSHFKVIANHYGLPNKKKELIKMYEQLASAGREQELYEDTYRGDSVQTLTNEEWVHAWGPFYVSNLARVKKVSAGGSEKLVNQLKSSRVPRVFLSHLNKTENILLKKLVYYSFNPLEAGCQVYHLDGDINNCELSNLTKVLASTRVKIN